MFCVLGLDAPARDTIRAHPGITSLIGFALALTRVDSVFAGRAYAAYGGIYIAASLVWLWVVERQTPTRADLLGVRLRSSGHS